MKKILFIILCCLISVMFSIKTSANKLENIKYLASVIICPISYFI